MKCYDEWWLPKDMENMGYLFEYCDKYCKVLYNIQIDKIKLLTAFMCSEFRKEMEEGHPKFLSQAAKDSLVQWLNVDYDGDISAFKTRTKEKYAENQMYWIGWMYGYIHFRTKLPSKEIVKELPITEMLQHYYLGHEMSKQVYFDRISNRFSESDRKMG